MMEEFEMSIAYGILCVISLALIGVCLAVDRKKDICLLLLFISVFVCNLGQFLISIAPNLSFALNGNTDRLRTQIQHHIISQRIDHCAASLSMVCAKSFFSRASGRPTTL